MSYVSALQGEKIDRLKKDTRAKSQEQQEEAANAEILWS